MTPVWLTDRRYLATSTDDGAWMVLDHHAPHTYVQVCTVTAADRDGQVPGSAAGRRAHWIAAALNAMPEATQ